MKNILLVDGDILAYTIASNSEQAIHWGDDLWTLSADFKECKDKVKEYLKNISKNFKNKSFNIKHLKKMDDDLAINYITRLKGLGVWSAQMFLMFNLNRPDIFPVKDIGLIRAISINYKKPYPPSKKFLNTISKLHYGYRSVFTWYMWRSIDPVNVEY